jgi:ribosome-associated protein
MDAENLIWINDSLSIPRAELGWRFDTSGGPGGQHANRSATRVTLLFDVAHSPSLDAETRARLLQRLQARLDRQGVLQISVQDSRSQQQNRETAVARFQTLLGAALARRKKRRPTRPSQAAQERRLAHKKNRGRRKQERRRDYSNDN